jgi:hypothetical protein
MIALILVSKYTKNNQYGQKTILKNAKACLISSFCFVFVDKLPEQDTLTQQVGTSRHDELTTGTGHRHVQLAVNETVAFLKGVGREEIELIGVLHAEGIDDDIPL